jgi:S-adenosylmethionine decarboxylase
MSKTRDSKTRNSKDIWRCSLLLFSLPDLRHDTAQKCPKVAYMQGLHLTADLTQCQCDAHWLTDGPRLLAYCVQATLAAGLQPVNQLAHTFSATAHGPGGVTATVLLAESHLCVHTWPEQGGVTVDVYVCNLGSDHSHKAHHLMNAMIALFAPEQASRQSLLRG